MSLHGRTEKLAVDGPAGRTLARLVDLDRQIALPPVEPGVA